MNHHISSEMHSCIDACLDCYKTCTSMAMSHCPAMGGDRTEPKHFRLMLACAEICRASAHFMLIGSENHRHVCKKSAEICTECADDCERVGDMDDCVAACWRCAESCSRMAA